MKNIAATIGSTHLWTEDFVTYALLKSFGPLHG